MKRVFFKGFVFLVLCGHAAAGSLFPFYDDIQTAQGSFFAVRPFYSHTVVKEGEIRDYVWPLYSRKEFKDEQSSRALIFWYTHKFNAQQQSPRDRSWLLPIYFKGRDVDGKEYFALFPLGGTIREFLGRDEILFALFPVFGKSRINDVKTTSVLWPIYSHTRGTGIERDRVFPIYGKSVLEGKYEKHFILWPFWNSADYFYPGDSGKSWLLFPVCGRAKMDHESTVWVIPPLFRFTEGDKQNRMTCPWPFIQKVESEKYDKMYVWPLWGEKQFKPGLKHRTFVLWPIFWSEKSTESNLTKTRRMALPFFFLDRSFLEEKGVEKADRVEVSNYWKIWPLMSWQRDGEVSRFRMLEVWPIKNSAPVERNWTPLWTLYKRTNADGVVRKDVLWFAWHSEASFAAEQKEWSLLKGLLAYKRDGEKQSLRLLYFVRLGEEK
ncbi:MAG: hypothetical protein IT583_02945 [Verrucomicrobia bacterium]|nr:hypothetical protein [Verrucomicrobiota bacterium]